MRRCDALVVGGGPAGASAAIALARAGWSVIVAEKSAFPRAKVCGEYISGAAWPLLEELGVASQVAASAGPEIKRVGLFCGDAALEAAMPSAHGFRAGRALGRDRLDTLLLDHAREAGARVLQPARVTGVREIEVDGAPEPVDARVVIGAHGAWEPGTLATQPSHEAAAPHDLLGFKARFTSARLSAQLMPLLLFPGGYGGMVTTDGGSVSLSCCVRRDALARARAHAPGLRAGEAVLAHIVRHTRGAREALEGAELDGAWLSAGPIRPAIRSFRRGGVFAIGNAAGEAHPVVAEGISMAIQSAFLLCDRLRVAGPRASPQALDAVARDYAKAWRRNFSARCRAAALFAASGMHPAGRAAAPWLFSVAPSLLTLGARWSGKDRALARLTGARG